MATVWREPDEESVDLYPGLVVHDGRVSGSITTGQSRLPLWAFIHTALGSGWDEVEAGWSPSDYGWTQGAMSEFLHNLLETRGEFGRLLLVLADVERVEGEREEEAAPTDVVVYTTAENRVNFPVDENTTVLTFDDIPPSWWEQEDLRQRVVEQLRRCLAALEGNVAEPESV